MNTRSLEKARTRERYLTAGALMFAERGFHAVSIDALGQEVGVSGPAFYRHFDSKEALLAEILVGASERLLGGLAQILDAAGLSDSQRLHRLVDFHLDFALASREVIRLQDRELATLPAESNRQVRRLQRRYLDGWAGLVGRLRPELSLAARRVLMHAVFGILNSTAHNAALASQRKARAVLSDAAVAAIYG